ncbi:unnamed protein product [Haemonchus placei]|uniref:SCP domain-containing protein n=1 Tax=Haemonchus placei TaxID=6290 RepID=A0A0N4WMX7_HAEPC|nr:unnamed protein product [Haemonchus placei]
MHLPSDSNRVVRRPGQKCNPMLREPSLGANADVNWGVILQQDFGADSDAGKARNAYSDVRDVHGAYYYSSTIGRVYLLWYKT